MSPSGARSLLVVAVLCGIAAFFFTIKPGRHSPPKLPRGPSPEAEVPSGASAELSALLSTASPKTVVLFDQVEELARQLNDSELRGLAAELEFPAAPDAISDGVRCAVYAEWARRDAPLVLEHLHRAMAELIPGQSIEGELDETRPPHSFRLAWFSSLRGWAETHPQEALAAIEEREQVLSRRPGEPLLAEPPYLGVEATLAAEIAVREMTRTDAKHTWRRIAGSASRWGNAGGVKTRGASWHLARAQRRGFFNGLVSIPQFEEYLEQLPASWLNNPLIMASSRRDTIRGDPEANRDKEFLFSVALAYARYDPEAAKDWVFRSVQGTLGIPGDLERRLQRVREFWRRWGRSNPTQALASMPRITDPESRAEIAAGVIQSDPTRTAEVLALFSDREEAEFILRVAAETWKPPYSRLRERYPRPGISFRLWSEEQCLEAMRRAIEQAPLDGEAKRSIHDALKRAVGQTQDNTSTSEAGLRTNL